MTTVPTTRATAAVVLNRRLLITSVSSVFATANTYGNTRRATPVSRGSSDPEGEKPPPWKVIGLLTEPDPFERFRTASSVYSRQHGQERTAPQRRLRELNVLACPLFRRLACGAPGRHDHRESEHARDRNPWEAVAWGRKSCRRRSIRTWMWSVLRGVLRPARFSLGSGETCPGTPFRRSSRRAAAGRVDLAGPAVVRFIGPVFMRGMA